jgi:hypothetical protein
MSFFASLRETLLFAVAALLLALPCMAATPAKLKPGESPLAASELIETDKAEIAKLFQQLASEFRAGNAMSCRALFVLEARREIAISLEREFQQSQYVDFSIGELRPDDSVNELNLHSVDVSLSYRIKGTPPVRDVEDTVTHTFWLRKDGDRFLFVRSSFFDGLGLRRGIWIMVGNALLGVIVGVALLTFWSWMGWEVYRARPRRYVWRILVLIPIAGAALFFAVVYLPSLARRLLPGARPAA